MLPCLPGRGRGLVVEESVGRGEKGREESAGREGNVCGDRCVCGGLCGTNKNKTACPGENKMSRQDVANKTGSKRR